LKALRRVQLARDGDIIDTKGIRFKLPLKVLESHDNKKPIGHVIDAVVEQDQIRVRVQIAQAGVADYIDEAWRKIKARLYDGFSIGWRTLKGHFDKSFGGFRHTETDWYELSTVAVPADSLALITSVRHADHSTTAIGQRPVSVSTVNNPGVSGASRRKVPMKETIREQIQNAENKIAANETRQNDIADLCDKDGRTRTEPEIEECETLSRETDQLKGHIQFLKDREARSIASATVVTPQNTNTSESAASTRSGVISVRSNAPKGIGVARMAIAMMRSGGNPYMAVQLANKHWPDSGVGEYIRTVVDAGDTTTSGWASQLVPSAAQLGSEFLEMLRDRILIGRIPGLKKVPFNIAVPLQSGGGTYGYIGEGAPKPVTKPTYGSATLRFEKAAGIIVITEELARFSNPDAELLVRNEMLEGLTRFFDGVFLSANAGVSNVQPAGILNGISSTAVTGTTAAKFRVDFNTIMQKHITNKRDPARLVLLMSSGMAMSLASMVNSLGQPDFPTINAQGGSFLGVPIVASGVVGTSIVLIDPGDILIAEDPAIRIDVSREASVEMDDAPAQGEQSPVTTISTLKSFWQNNLVGIRAEQFRTWKVARTSAVEYLVSAAYVPS
jgi:HK97 family phage major capsid protein